MIKQFRHQDITWIDAINPSKEELSKLTKDYGIHSLVETELSSPSLRSRVDLYENYLYLILHFPTCQSCSSDKTKITPKTEEIDFILSDKFLITIHYEPIQALEEFGQIFEANFSLDENKNKKHAGYLFSYILTSIYRLLDTNLDIISTDLTKAETKIFSGQEKAMVLVLSDINRELLNFMWILKSHKATLSSLERALTDLFKDELNYHFASLRHTYDRVYTQAVNLRELYLELRNTNESLLTIKTNEIMKTLTIMAFITFPLTVFTSTFGMNTINTPIIGSPNDFWIIIVIMLGAVTFMFSFFRYKNWI